MEKFKDLFEKNVQNEHLILIYLLLTLSIFYLTIKSTTIKIYLI
jgi:hypothetical protein